jgi:3-phosphoshikimate 1-carboxyvinyltransferase
MIVKLSPSPLSGSLFANASKSAMQRACAAALLCGRTSVISNAGQSNDDLAALGIIEAMGASVGINASNKTVNIVGNKTPFSAQASDARRLFCGESGLSIRMFTPIAALSPHPVTIWGEGSLSERPMHFFAEVLPQLGVTVDLNNGRIPMHIQGPLVPKDIEVDGSLSSQFLTGLLMAYAGAGAKDVSIHVRSLKSKPYIDLTLQIMQHFGLAVPENHGYETFLFSRSNPHEAAAPVAYTVEGDWSGAAFLLVAGAFSGEIEVKGLFSHSRQADKRIVDALLDAGALVQVYADRVLVARKRLAAFSFDATDCPDLFPPLVALASYCPGISTLRGLRRLKHKESDRGATLQEEFAKLGVGIDLSDDEMKIHGKGKIQVQNHVLNSHHDHRIAMACAVAASHADFPVAIRNADAVNKSYPDFWNHLKALGARLEIEENPTHINSQNL